MDGGGEGGGGCCDLQERAAWWWSLLDVAETRSSRGSDAREMLAGLSERSRTKSAPTPSLNSERASLKRQRHNVSLDSLWNTRWLGKSELQLVFILLFFFPSCGSWCALLFCIFVCLFLFYSCTSAHACFGEQTVAAKWFHCAADATMRDETPLHAVVVSLLANPSMLCIPEEPQSLNSSYCLPGCDSLEKAQWQRRWKSVMDDPVWCV